MSNFTLDDIRAAAEKKYGQLVIEFGNEKVELRNPLRLSKDERKTLVKIQNEMDEAENDEGFDQEEAMKNIIILVAKEETSAKHLIAEIGDDLTVLAQIFASYGEATQAGEASGSQS